MIAYSNKIVQWVWHFNQMRFYSFKGADSKVYEIHFTIILKDVVSCQKTYYEKNQIENKTSLTAYDLLRCHTLIHKK